MGAIKASKKDLVPAQTKFMCHKTAGLLNFFGGDFTAEKISDMPFGEVVNHILTQGGDISITVLDTTWISPTLLDEL